MAFITLDKTKLAENFSYLDKIFKKNSIHWSVVSKILCGNRDFLTELLKLDIKQICDSRVTNLKIVKSISPDIETIYIKPPAKRSIAGVIKYADISMNTEIKTIEFLSDEAQKQGKIHKIVIMIELGELRDGVMGEKLIDFYQKVFNLKSIEVVGIGANLSCLYGVLPNYDKLIQLSLYKQLIEVKFNKKIPYVSGGSSVTIPLIEKKLLPKAINHFRVGETLFLGTDVYENRFMEGMNSDVFKLYAEIIELTEKPNQPSGKFGTNVDGHSYQFESDKINECSYRAIIDIGLLDVDNKHIFPVDTSITFAGASSDMIVLDFKENKNLYKVGDLVEFTMDYMGTLRVLNSRYIDKKIV